MPYTTYADLVDHCLAYAGKDADRAATADYRRAVLAAYAELAAVRNWSYLWTLGRVTLSAAYSTGTVTYDHTGGANERELTLASGTWPTWAAYGYVVINDIPYEVATRVSNSVVTLDEASNPGADVAAGTAYGLLRDTYPLPSDFVSGDETVTNSVGTVLNYAHPRVWGSQRRTNTGPGEPVVYTHTGDPDVTGGRAIRFWPPPDQAYAVDVLYRRRPRALTYDKVEDGLVSVSAGTTVTGANTLFKAGHVGAVIRISSGTTERPTGRTGGLPFVEERKVTAVASATSLTVDSAFTVTEAGVGYTISDPADVDPDVHSNYLLRLIEQQYRLFARMKPLDTEEQHLQLAQVRAYEADAKYSGRRAAGRPQGFRSRMTDYPMDMGT